MNTFAAISCARPATPAPNARPGSAGFGGPLFLLPALPAVIARPSGPNSLDRPSGAKAPRSLAIPQHRLRAVFAAPKTPRFDALLAQAAQQYHSSQANAVEFQTLAATLTARAEAEEWSRREFSKRTGIPRTTWARLLSGKADLSAWLPKVREAAARLQTPCNP